MMLILNASFHTHEAALLKMLIRQKQLKRFFYKSFIYFIYEIVFKLHRKFQTYLADSLYPH
jgi:hypothetical protein